MTAADSKSIDTVRKQVGIIGTGTMGAGIAQVAADAGWKVWLRDVDTQTAHRAVAEITNRFDRLVEKDRMTPGERDAAVKRLHVAETLNDLHDC